MIVKNMRRLVSVLKVINPNRICNCKCLLFQCDVPRLTLITCLCYSDKKPSDTTEESKVKCEDESKSKDPCDKAATVKLLPTDDPVKHIPKDYCSNVEVKQASLRPYVNPCPKYPPCDPVMQPVHPCTEKPPRIQVKTDDVKTELSMKTKKVLLALSMILGGIVIYKALQKPEDKTPKGGPKRPRCVLRPQYIKKDPPYANEIPHEAQYLIIGAGTASFSAFRTIKSLDPTAQILIVSEEPYIPYMRPPLSKDLIIAGEKNQINDLSYEGPDGKSRSIYYEPDEYFTPLKEYETSENGGVFILKGWKVKGIDPAKKIVSLEVSKDDGAAKHIKYEKCLIASGARANNLPVFEFNTDDIDEKVTCYRTVYDYMEIEDVISCGAKKIAVIGANTTACELASSLASRGIEVIQIIKDKGVMSCRLPEYLSEWVTSKLEKSGVQIMKNCVLEDAMIVNDSLKLITKERDSVVVDHAVVAAGSTPAIEFTEGVLEVDEKNGGLLANTEMQIRSGLYGAGDCVSFFEPKLGRRRIENHDHALVSGRIAGENMVGGMKSYDYDGVFYSVVNPNVEFESVGVIDSKLPTVGVFLDKNSVSVVESSKKKKVIPEEYNRGILFYLKKQSVVGILMWNLSGRGTIANHILFNNVPYEKLDETAKLFKMHV